MFVTLKDFLVSLFKRQSRIDLAYMLHENQLKRWNTIECISTDGDD